MTSYIPTVTLSSSNAEISESISTLGFLFLKSPSVPSKEQIDELFEISSQFFLKEPLEEKEKVKYSSR